MFIYVVIEVIKYFSGEQISVYEVTENRIADDDTYQGLAIREEHIVNTEESGYVSYYVGEGKKIAKNSVVYSVDQTGKVYDLLSKNEQQKDLEQSDILEVRECISSYRSSFKGSNYRTVYEFKNKIESAAMDLTNINLMASLSELSKKKDLGNSFKLVKAQTSGTIAFYTDGLENVTVDNFTEKNFDTSRYKRVELRSQDKKQEKSSAYKLITNENWNIAVPLTEAQATKLAEKSVVKVTFLQDRLYTNATFKIIERDGKKYGIVGLRNYIQQYLPYRYLNIAISTAAVEGYKVPKSAVTEKEYYKVPTSFFTKGGDSNDLGLVKVSYDKGGKQNVQFVATDIIYRDDKYSYVDTSYFEKGDIICNQNENSKQFEIREKKSLQGVYNVNKGYPAFRLIEVLAENDDYYIVNKKTENGLNNYDHIILNVSLAKQQKYVD